MILAATDAFLASYVLLWAFSALAVVAALGAARQVALITKRFPLEHVDDMPGPKVGEAPIPIEGSTLDGQPVALAPPFDERTLVVFTSDTCDGCSRIVPDVEQVVEEAQPLELWFVYAESPTEEFALDPGRAARSVVSNEAFTSWRIGSVPYAYLASEDGRIQAKGHLPHVEHLRATLGLSPEHEEDADKFGEAWEHAVA
jgi:methylamine dehydrogenase accessory protein MauD